MQIASNIGIIIICIKIRKELSQYYSMFLFNVIKKKFFIRVNI